MKGTVTLELEDYDKLINESARNRMDANSLRMCCNELKDMLITVMAQETCGGKYCFKVEDIMEKLDITKADLAKRYAELEELDGGYQE